MEMNKPFYMTNESWFYHDDESGRDVLTDKAPPEAVKSYKEYWEALDKQDADNAAALVSMLKKR